MFLKTDTSSQSHFAKVPTISRSRNAFGVAEKLVTTIQFDKLYPIYHKFIYPGDTLSVVQKSIARLNTQVAVLHDDLYIDLHAWFVPMRLIHEDWARFQFNTKDNPSQDNSALKTPWIAITGDLVTTGFASKSLYDYFGYPTLVPITDVYKHINNYLPRAYNLIWNTNYRDENLQNPVTVDLDTGADSHSDYVLLNRGKRHDKFTSCLPFLQKGDESSLPISGYAPVEMYANNGNWVKFYRVNGTTPLGIGDVSSDSVSALYNNNQGVAGIIDPNGTLRADLSSGIITPSVNDLRQSIAVQQLLEADARGGTRDVESILHRWGVQVPDFRLQRPEYLGGATFGFDGHLVPQTSETGTTPQGNLAQFSASQQAFNINHSFVEHGVMMILISCRSNITYQSGLQKELSYQTRFDFYQPEFANLGEVAVKDGEINFVGDTNDDSVFGYQEYGYELRYSENRVTGEMRSNYATSRDYQHLADDYASTPTLGSSWIQSSTDISRNISVSTSVADPIELNCLVQGTIARTMPMYSVPGLTRL